MASKKTRKEKKQQIKKFLAQTPQEDYDKAINKFFRAYESPNLHPPSIEEDADKNTDVSSVRTSVDTPVRTSVSTPVYKKQHRKQRTPRGVQTKFEYLDATHSASEQKVYSVLYRESKNMQSSEIRVRISEIINKTGLSDKTVRTALHCLENKLSITILERSKSPYGRLYRIYDPKDILDRRKSINLKIDPVTKQIRSTGTRSPTPVLASVNTPVKSSVLASVNTPATTLEEPPVKITEPTSVKTTDVNKETPFINKNSKIKCLYSASSKSTSDNVRPKQDTNYLDEKQRYSHKDHVIALYEKYTLNSWKPTDNEAYENIKDVLPDVVEAAIITSVLRCKSKVNSLAYCEGAIKEYINFLPPGYVNYLREKWNEIKKEET